ncbi:hypothetical protein BDW71DRAFT_194171 [Aspergillus fruticulosus]
MAEQGAVDFKLYRYTPNRAAAGLFVALFSLTTLYHVSQLWRRRAWYFIAFVSPVQIIGYICRIVAHDAKESVPIYSIQTILILLAPPLCAALRRFDLHELSLVSVRWMTKIFVTGDVIAFVMQAAVQLVFFGVFMATCGLFHWRIRQKPTHSVAALSARLREQKKRGWEAVLVGLYAASVLILVRSVFRLVEYVQGNDGYLISHEVFMYVFDAVLMFLAMLVMNMCHPSMILTGSERDGDAEMSVVE